ncbi:NUDIX hydrolase [Nocardia carnea]|uniref:NUDIX hydrolase n=1 Tax=Nocardia carnea TaxID=37328 RepID=UPI002458669E|nr:NUDIX domain-containing protein [Nocardia carnea]
MSFRLAAYAVCVTDGRVLLACHRSRDGESTWTLPGGRVEHGEDPCDAVTRELTEETGCHGIVERLLGVDSRVIPAAVARAGTESSRTVSASVADASVSASNQCVSSVRKPGSLLFGSSGGRPPAGDARAMS